MTASRPEPGKRRAPTGTVRLGELEALLELLPAGDPRGLEVHEAMSGVLEWIVEHRADIGTDAGLEAMRRIGALLGPSSPQSARGAAKLALSVLVGWGQGDTEAAVRLAAEAEELFGAAGDVPARLLATNEIGYLHWIAGDFGGFDIISDGVLAAAEQAGDRFALLQALCAVAHTRQLGGDLAGSLEVLDRAVDLARADGRLYRVSYALAQSAYSHALLGDPATATTRLQEGKQANPDYRATVLSDYAMQLDWLGGRLAACVATFEEQLEWTGGHSRRRALGASAAAMAAAEQGDAAGARRILEPASAAASGRDARPQSDQLWWAAGVTAALAGERQAAAQHLAAGLRRQHDGGWGAGPFARLMLADLAELAAEGGDTGLAAQVYDFSPTSDVAACGRPLAGLARFAAEAVAVGQGDGDAAAALLETADLFERSGWPLLSGRAIALAGRAAAGAGRRDEAVEALTVAAGRFDACGALVRRDAALTELRRLGAPGPECDEWVLPFD